MLPKLHTYHVDIYRTQDELLAGVDVTAANVWDAIQQGSNWFTDYQQNDRDVSVTIKARRIEDSKESEALVACLSD